MRDLSQKKCVPCEGGISKLGQEEIIRLLREVPGWKQDGDRIARTLTFNNFVEAMKFVNKMAEIAEREGHHPDFTVHYNRVEVVIWTHAIGGLSENDFILAAKINEILS